MDELTETILELVRPEIERIVDERMAQPVQRKWMRTPEAAEYLGIGVEALAARARRGRIPARKDGHYWLFNRDELDAFFTR